MDRPGTRFLKKSKMQILTPIMQILATAFLLFFTKNVKMKINHPKLLFNIKFLWLKSKLEQLTPIFKIFTRHKKLK